MKHFDYDDLHKEFKLGMLAGITLILGISAIAVCVYLFINPQILG